MTLTFRVFNRGPACIWCIPVKYNIRKKFIYFATTLKSLNPNIKIYGVETYGADSMYQSINTGKLVELPAITSIAESLGAKKVTEKTFEIVKHNVDDLVRITDEQAMQQLLEILQQEKLLVEPATSCSLSAILTNQIPDIQGKEIAIVLCGGNFSIEKLKEYIKE